MGPLQFWYCREEFLDPWVCLLPVPAQHRPQGVGGPGWLRQFAKGQEVALKVESRRLWRDPSRIWRSWAAGEDRAEALQEAAVEGQSASKDQAEALQEAAGAGRAASENREKGDSTRPGPQPRLASRPSYHLPPPCWLVTKAQPRTSSRSIGRQLTPWVPQGRLLTFPWPGCLHNPTGTFKELEFVACISKALGSVAGAFMTFEFIINILKVQPPRLPHLPA